MTLRFSRRGELVLLTLLAVIGAAAAQEDSSPASRPASSSTQAVATSLPAAGHGVDEAGKPAPRAPLKGWELIEQNMSSPMTAPEKRDELRRLEELARAVLGDDVTPAQLVKAAQPKLLEWLQIDERVKLPAGVPEDEEGAWSGIDARLRETTRWLLWGEAQPDFLAMCAAPVLLDWLGDQFSRRLAEHYMRLENLTFDSEYYFAFTSGRDAKLDMPSSMKKAFSVRVCSRPDRTRAEVTVDGQFIWGVVSRRRGEGFEVIEWTAKERVGPYHYALRYTQRGSLRAVPAKIAPPYAPVACLLAQYVIPVVGGDLVTRQTQPLAEFAVTTRTGRNLYGNVSQYDGIAQSVLGNTCYRFECANSDMYRGWFYISTERGVPYVCQLDGAHRANPRSPIVGVIYGRITFSGFSTAPIPDSVFEAPEGPGVAQATRPGNTLLQSD